MPAQKTRLLLLLLALSGSLHLFRLAEPAAVVFDEVHFGAFADAYCCTGGYFFDIHPPHAKLVIAGVAALRGYRGGEHFDELDGPLAGASAAALRLAPALAGTLLPLVLFGLLLQLGASPMAALFGGLIAALDNALLLQTRVVALDGFLLLATFGALGCFLASRRSPRRSRRTALQLGAGLLAGLAVGTKFTGLVALGLIGICIAVELLRAPGVAGLRMAARETVWVLAGAVFVYAAGWALHFALLPEPGSGHIWGAPRGDFLFDTVHVHRQMFASNLGLTAPHPYSSAWWSWPFMVRPVFYWSGSGSSLYLLGNPLVWWGTTLLLAAVVVNQLLLRGTNLQVAGLEARAPRVLWLPLLGYVASLAPLAPVSRALFLYHYFTPLLFGVCVVVLWLDRVGWTRSGGWGAQRASFHLATAALVLGFLAASPFSLPFVVAPAYQEWIFELLPAWR